MDDAKQVKDVINWYPGHMNKSINIMHSKINEIDFYIEVLDSRAINFSSNKDLNKIFNNKPKVVIALKSDLSENYVISDDILYGCLSDKSFRSRIIKKINDVCKNKIESKKRKGFVNFQLFGMVVGLPNIGKSSLINFLSNRNKLIVENKPGVTKKISNIKLSENIVLFDTPGIFFKRVENFDIGAILTIIKSVNFDIVNKYKVLEFHYHFLLKFYKNDLFTFFKFNNELTFDEFIDYVCKIKKFKLKNNENDYERCFLYIYSKFSSADICKISFDKYYSLNSENL